MASEGGGRLIVVAVDPGEESLYALTWCLNNVINTSPSDAENSKDTLILLYARPPRAVYPSMDGSGYLFSSDIMASMDRYGKEVADTVLERARRICSNHHFVNVETKVEIGDPRDVICEAVDKLNADMLVMGSHGYGLIKRFTEFEEREKGLSVKEEKLKRELRSYQLLYEKLTEELNSLEAKVEKS